MEYEQNNPNTIEIKDRILKSFSEETFKTLSRFPQQAKATMIKYYGNIINHISEDSGEIIPRSEYMDLLQRSAIITGPFLGCSRQSARQLLEGKEGLKRLSIFSHFIPFWSKFFMKRVVPIICTLATFYQLVFGWLLIVIVGSMNIRQEGNWLTSIILAVIIIIAYVFIIYELKEFKDAERTKREFLEDKIHIYDRFDRYNETLSTRIKAKYPTTRLFILDIKQIEEDNKKINRKINMTWWEYMVKEHHRYDIDIARICLTEKLKSNYPLLSRQFSLFCIPGEGGWVITTKEHMDRTVRVNCRGKDSFYRFSTTLGAIYGLAHLFTFDEKESKVVERSKSIHDFSLCSECTVEGHHRCKNSDCPLKSSYN